MYSGTLLPTFEPEPHARAIFASEDNLSAFVRALSAAEKAALYELIHFAGTRFTGRARGLEEEAMTQQQAERALRDLVARRGGACRVKGDRLVFADEPEFGAHDQQCGVVVPGGHVHDVTPSIFADGLNRPIEAGVFRWDPTPDHSHPCRHDGPHGGTLVMKRAEPDTTWPGG